MFVSICEMVGVVYWYWAEETVVRVEQHVQMGSIIVGCSTAAFCSISCRIE